MSRVDWMQKVRRGKETLWEDGTLSSFPLPWEKREAGAHRIWKRLSFLVSASDKNRRGATAYWVLGTAPLHTHTHTCMHTQIGSESRPKLHIVGMVLPEDHISCPQTYLLSEEYRLTLHFREGHL